MPDRDAAAHRTRVAGVKVLLVADGDMPPLASLSAGILAGTDMVIAADAGARRCLGLGLRPDLVVGDFDSADPALLERLRADGIPIVRVPAEKDESDLELALRAAIDRGASSVVVLGALGGPRVEHALAAIELLLLACERGVEMALVDDRSTIRLLRGGERDGTAARLEVVGELGDYVSLFAWGGGVSGVSTEGMRYPLRDEPLPKGPSRGLSNELLVASGAVCCRAGHLLVVHTRRAAVVAPNGQDTGEGGHR